MELKPSISAVCFDIDGTLVDEAFAGAQIHENHLCGNYVLDLIAAHIAGQDTATSRRQLAAYTEENVYWDYTDIIARFQLDRERVLAEMERYHENSFIVYWRNVQLLRELAGAGYQIFIVSNNPYSGCMMKIKQAGLSVSGAGTRINGIFGSNQGLGQKSNPAFWKRVIMQTGLPAESLAMIGDNPYEDGELPQLAGYGQCFLTNGYDAPREFSGNTTLDSVSQ